MSDRSQRYLTVRILYPKRGHEDDILAAVRKISEAARKFVGLVEIGAWTDKEHDRIVSVSLWESKEQALHATAAMHPQFADIPWSEWERQPGENIPGLSRVV